MTEKFLYSSTIPASAQAVYQWHAQPGALERLTPPWERSKIVEQTGGIEDVGSHVKIRVGLGPISQVWTAEHAAFETGRMFRDVMVSGPFRRWEHTHLFRPLTETSSTLEDHVEYELPMGALGRLIAGPYIRRRLQKMFAWRHQVTAEALAPPPV